MFHHIQTHAFIGFGFNLVCKMNQRLWSVVAIIIVLGFASNVLFVNPAFAGNSEARKAAKEREKQLVDTTKKAKDKASAIKHINALNNKLATLQDQLAKTPSNSAIISKIADVLSKIAKWQKKL
jgi:hypothetical protein